MGFVNETVGFTAGVLLSDCSALFCADLCHKLAELGWLYRKVRQFIDSKTKDKSQGLVGQVHIHLYVHRKIVL